MLPKVVSLRLEAELTLALSTCQAVLELEMREDKTDGATSKIKLNSDGTITAEMAMMFAEFCESLLLLPAPLLLPGGVLA